MVLQHAAWYHEARDWIRHQDLSQLTYQALLSHCKMLESWCEQFQKVKEWGHANLASITTATSSLHLDALSISSKHCCRKCGYSHPQTNVLQKVNSAMHAVATIISLCYASKEDNARKTSRPCKEASSPDAVLAVITELCVMPATPHADTAIEAQTIVALQDPFPQSIT